MNISINGASALNIAQIALSSTQEDFVKIVESLASGSSATISPADLYVSTDIDTDTAARYTAIENAQQGVNLTQIADGALSDVNKSLSRIMELSTKAASDIYSDAQRNAIQAEINQLTEHISKSLESANYNGKELLNVVNAENPDKNKDISFQVGTGSTSDSIVSYDPNINLEDFAFDVSSAESSRESMKKAGAMIEAVSTKRSEIAATQAGLMNSVESNMTAIINGKSSYSNITDTNYASAMADLLSNQLTQKSIIAVMSQTIKSQGSVLNLISGIGA